MRLRLTAPAARQLDRVLDYIADRHPGDANRVHRHLPAIMHMLLEYPEAGTSTHRRGIRRIVASPYPYAVIYRAGE